MAELSVGVRREGEATCVLYDLSVGLLVLCDINYVLFYYVSFGYWGLGNHHMEHLTHAFPNGESLVWNFWWIIPLLWNEWFFHNWPFYTHEHH